MQPRLALNTYLHLLITGITDMHHHAGLGIDFI
jgi:hypothetical protein